MSPCSTIIIKKSTLYIHCRITVSFHLSKSTMYVLIILFSVKLRANGFNLGISWQSFMYICKHQVIFAHIFYFCFGILQELQNVQAYIWIGNITFIFWVCLVIWLKSTLLSEVIKFQLMQENIIINNIKGFSYIQFLYIYQNLYLLSMLLIANLTLCKMNDRGISGYVIIGGRPSWRLLRNITHPHIHTLLHKRFTAIMVIKCAILRC